MRESSPLTLSIGLKLGGWRANLQHVWRCLWRCVVAVEKSNMATKGGLGLFQMTEQSFQMIQTASHP